MKNKKMNLKNKALKGTFVKGISEKASTLTKGRVTTNGFEPQCRTAEYRRG